MSIGEDAGEIHPMQTRRSHHRYLFYVKHHGGDHRAARWCPEISREAEFAIFDTADDLEISDERGWLYGVGARDADDHLPELGTWGQQVAEFPRARPEQPWHGYPLWPLEDAGPQNRRGEFARPSKQVFRIMVERGLLTDRERKRLTKGHHV
jgi:hypothetical protein